jgi:hypothetical protein
MRKVDSLLFYAEQKDSTDIVETRVFLPRTVIQYDCLKSEVIDFVRNFVTEFNLKENVWLVVDHFLIKRDSKVSIHDLGNDLYATVDDLRWLSDLTKVGILDRLQTGELDHHGSFILRFKDSKVIGLEEEA